jgi:hypothetical protein
MGRPFFFDLKAVAAAALVSCLAAGGFCAVSVPGVARNGNTTMVSVDRTKKGDRLPPHNVELSRGPTSSLPAAVAFPRKVPLGCDPAFSAVVDPARANIFGRCTS